jgi:hypothetical protein
VNLPLLLGWKKECERWKRKRGRRESRGRIREDIYLPFMKQAFSLTPGMLNVALSAPTETTR